MTTALAFTSIRYSVICLPVMVFVIPTLYMRYPHVSDNK